MLFATAVWSVVAALTFALARAMGAYAYRAFFQGLLGPAWVLFEAAYIVFVILILAVFGAAAGAIGAATFGWPEPGGSALLALLIVPLPPPAPAAVRPMFNHVSYLLTHK